MENQNKYLLLARRAREEDNAEDAKKYYDMVRTEDPDNAEAKFYYSYYRMFSDTQGHAYSNYVDFCKGVKPTISMVIASDDTDSEKKAFLKTMLNCLEDTYSAASSANRNIGGSHSIDIRMLYNDTKETIVSKFLSKYGEDDVDLLVA